MIPDSITCVRLEGQAWSVVIDEERKLIYLDVRDEKEKNVTIVQLDLATLKLTARSFDLTWWSQLVEVIDENLYFVMYRDQNDPTNKKYYRLNWSDGSHQDLVEIPLQNKSIGHPHIYEHGSEYHKTVAEFLAIDLALSCEYLEWDDKIIISYYLRSDNGFDRYLLLLQNGEKVWKVKQDEQMKGFSSGSFFVFQEQLIFIKDRNEVCVYSG